MNAAAAGVPLSRSGLFVDDRDGDGRWSAGEAVWRNRPLLDGEVGLGGILHYADADGDGRRGAGEPVWAETDAGAGAVSLSWNDSGCLTADGRRVYAWSADCRLQHTETATDKVEFLYDGQGRRLAKTVTRRDAPGSPVATFYVWDGWTVVEEIESARDAETGVWTETVVAEYLPGLGLDDHIVAFLDGEEIHFHQDHLGSVLMLTDADGAVLQRYRYDIHGNATVLDASGNELGAPSLLFQSEIANLKSEISPLSPYLFTGRRLDRETGLYYYRNRYYSPLLGKFISPDPLDYVDGMNVYAYVNGNVVNANDPMGTRWFNPLSGDFVAWRGGKKAWDGTKWTGEKAWDGTKWTGEKAWEGTKWTGEKAWDGTKWTGEKAWDAAAYPLKPFTGVAAGVRDYKSSTISGVYRVDYVKGKGWVPTPVSGINDPLVRGLKDVFVNGILNDLAPAAELAGEHTNIKGGRNSAILLHNPKSGFFADVTETGLDKLLMNSAVANSVADQLEQRQGQDLTLILHSQGGAIGTAALNMLADRGITAWSQLKVEHHGSASPPRVARNAVKRVGATWLDPKIHYFDLVPTVVGLCGFTNPVHLPGVPLSILASPFLFYRPWSPHTIYHR